MWLKFHFKNLYFMLMIILCYYSISPDFLNNKT